MTMLSQESVLEEDSFAAIVEIAQLFPCWQMENGQIALMESTRTSFAEVVELLVGQRCVAAIASWWHFPLCSPCSCRRVT
jgi:hypothetical protein